MCPRVVVQGRKHVALAPVVQVPRHRGALPPPRLRLRLAEQRQRARLAQGRRVCRHVSSLHTSHDAQSPPSASMS